MTSCIECGSKTYRSIGGKDICSLCGYNSSAYRDPYKYFDITKQLYHKRTFELLNKPIPSYLGNHDALWRFEYRTGIRLPVSFYEWYFYEDNPKLLAKYNLDGHAIPIDDFSEPKDSWDDYNPLDENILPFMHENQGVCTWAIPLNMGDDPEVLIEVASGTPPQWQRCADHFSQWVYCVVRNHLTIESASFMAQAEPLSSADLNFLQATFEEGKRTYIWPGRMNHYFKGRLGDMVIWAGDRQADWFITPSEGAALSLLKHLWSCSNLSISLWSQDDLATQQLQEIRQQNKKLGFGQAIQ
ncbi:MAG: hypothetical protein AAF702_34720 [Chloroflexota bacterium]